MTTTTTERPPTRQRYRPTELETVPAVNVLLERLGLGRLDPSAVTAFGGRNDNWAGPTTTGEQVFVKTVALTPDGDCPELQRALSFEELAERRLPPGSPLRSPALLGADRAAGVTVHRLVPGARSGAELALDGDFDDELCRAAGRAVGALHGLGPAEDVDTGEAPLPPLAWLKALPWSAVQERSMAQIAAWQLVQDDTEVVAALHRLRDLEKTVPHAPTHCDLRFDQFIRAAHKMDVPLPDGSIAHIEYAGDVAPKVTIAQRPLADAAGAWGMAFPSFAGFDRMMEQMQRQSQEMIRRAQEMARHPVGAGGAAPYIASYGNLPAGGTSTTVVSVSNGGGTCTRTTEVVSQGAGKPAKVTSNVSGQCGGTAAAPSGGAVNPV